MGTLAKVHLIRLTYENHLGGAANICRYMFPWHRRFINVQIHSIGYCDFWVVNSVCVPYCWNHRLKNLEETRNRITRLIEFVPHVSFGRFDHRLPWIFGAFRNTLSHHQHTCDWTSQQNPWRVWWQKHCSWYTLLHVSLHYSDLRSANTPKPPRTRLKMYETWRTSSEYMRASKNWQEVSWNWKLVPMPLRFSAPVLSLSPRQSLKLDEQTTQGRII